jgi:hypothetical protein
VPGNILSSELEQVRSELAAAEVEYASMGAKIAGLQARREALTRALSGMGEHDGKAGITRPRTDAIVDVLVAADTEMTIKDVIAALHDSGRENEAYDNVAADLAYLADRGRIVRLRRGVYGRPDRIVITLTEGSLKNSYINVRNHLGFFPADAVGPTNSRDGEGKMLTVRFDGLPGPVETDITGAPHGDFRRRGPTRQFFAHHDLKPGEKIAIEKHSGYEYRVLPAR